MSDATSIMVTWFVDGPEEPARDPVLDALNEFFRKRPGLSRIESHAGGRGPVECAVAMGSFDDVDAREFGRHAVRVADRLSRHGSLSWLQTFTCRPSHCGWRPLAAFEL